MDVDDKLLLKLHYINDEEDFNESFLKVYSNCETLEICKQIQDETPIFIEIATEDKFINDGEGIGLTLDQTKDLIRVLQSSVNYLE